MKYARTLLLLTACTLAGPPAHAQLQSPTGPPNGFGNSYPSVASGYFIDAGPPFTHVDTLVATAGTQYTVSGLIGSSWGCYTPPNCTASLNSLFGGSPFNAQVAFANGVFIMSALNVNIPGSTASTSIGVSSIASNPINAISWTTHAAPANVLVGGTLSYPSSLKMGVDSQAVYLTANLFSFSSGTQTGLLYRIIDKSQLLAGALVYQDIIVPTAVPTYATPVPTTAPVASAADRTYFVSAYLPITGTTSSVIRIETIVNPLSSPTLSSVDVAVAPYAVPQPGSGAVQSACSPGPTPLLSTLDGRIGGAAYVDCYIYAAHTILQGPSSNRHQVKWYEFESNGWDGTAATSPPKSRQQARINAAEIALPGETPDVFGPSIMVNLDRTVGLVCSVSSNQRPVGVYFTGREKHDKKREMAPLVQLKASSGCYSTTPFQSPQPFGACAIAMDQGSYPGISGTYFFAAGQYSGANPTQWIISLDQLPPPNVGPDEMNPGESNEDPCN